MRQTEEEEENEWSAKRRGHLLEMQRKQRHWIGGEEDEWINGNGDGIEEWMEEEEEEDGLDPFTSSPGQPRRNLQIAAEKRGDQFHQQQRRKGKMPKKEGGRGRKKMKKEKGATTVCTINPKPIKWLLAGSPPPPSSVTNQNHHPPVGSIHSIPSILTWFPL
jgi:hypothetical protein